MTTALIEQSNSLEICSSNIVEIDHSKILASEFCNYHQLYNPYIESNNFLSNAYLKSKCLPEEFHKSLYEFKYNSNQDGALLFKNLPIYANIPNTPQEHNEYLTRTDFICEFWLAAVAENLGAMISYKQDQDGRLFQDIFPIKKHEFKLTSSSSKLFLDFHTEAAFHPYKPDFVLLLCVRPDQNRLVPTFTAHVNDILKYFNQQEIDLLFKPIFHTAVDYSFGNINLYSDYSKIVSILYGNETNPYMLYDLDLMQGTNENAVNILKKLKEVIHKVKKYTILDTGDLLIIDNRFSAHARGAFTPKYNGEDRWLIRSFAVESLIPSAVNRVGNSRVINSLF